MGSVFAPDLVRHDSLFYIYFPLVTYVEGQMAGITNAVVYASSPEGPWSDPVDLKIGHIDPGHVADDQGKQVPPYVGRIFCSTGQGWSFCDRGNEKSL